MENLNINNIDFALKNLSISHLVDVSDLSRLKEVLAQDGRHEAISFTLTGKSNAYPLPSLTLKAKANLSVVCQRCLKAMLLPFEFEYDFVICDSEPDELEDDELLDWLEPSKSMDVIALLEDELLLAIPFAPVHATACNALKLESGQIASPFDVLKGKF